MRVCEPKLTEQMRWGFENKRGVRHFKNGSKTYIDYIEASDYSPARKKFIIRYYNYCLDFYNLREQNHALQKPSTSRILSYPQETT